MRIISDFKDYYDSVQSLGQDRSLIYYRKTKEVFSDAFPWIGSSHYLSSINYESFIIGFCGKIYPLIKISHVYQIDPKVKYDETICYNLEEIDNLIKTHYRDKQIAGYLSKKRSDMYRNYWSLGCRQQNFKEFFDKCEEKKERYKEYFLEHPVFVVKNRDRHRYIEYNACLKDFNFVRQVDVFTAYQQIQMHISNIAVPQKPIPEISNSDMIEAKGFDLKFSFRKDKS